MLKLYFLTSVCVFLCAIGWMCWANIGYSFHLHRDVVHGTVFGMATFVTMWSHWLWVQNLYDIFASMRRHKVRMNMYGGYEKL